MSYIPFISQDFIHPPLYPNIFQEPYPVNASYYMGDAYNPAYLHEPYGQNAYIGF